MLSGGLVDFLAQDLGNAEAVLEPIKVEIQ